MRRPGTAPGGIEPPAPGDGRRAAARPPQSPETILHASAVAAAGPLGIWRAALIIGRSGAGKSALALELMSRGAVLVADDRTILRWDEGRLLAACPPPIAGLIEARGIGLIRAPHMDDVQVSLVVDLDEAERDRLPPPRSMTLLGVSAPRILCAPTEQRATLAHAAAIHLLLRGSGAPEPADDLEEQS